MEVVRKLHKKNNCSDSYTETASWTNRITKISQTVIQFTRNMNLLCSILPYM